MAIYGDLSTMGLADLLQWAAMNEKTGVLEIERHKISRRIEFRKGWIGACSSDDPPSMLGQFLLSRGKITEEALREALARQEVTHENLGVILVHMGKLGASDLAQPGHGQGAGDDPRSVRLGGRRVPFPRRGDARSEPDGSQPVGQRDPDEGDPATGRAEAHPRGVRAPPASFSVAPDLEAPERA